MRREKFDEVLKTRCIVMPFRSFTVELDNGQRLEIDYPLAIRDGVAVYLAPGECRRLRYGSVNQIMAW